MAEAKNSGLRQNSVDRLIARSKFALKSMEMMEGDDGPPLTAEACPESVMDVENEDPHPDVVMDAADLGAEKMTTRRKSLQAPHAADVAKMD